MRALLRATAAEFAKTFTVRTWWILLLVLVGYVAFTAGLLALFVGDLGAALGGGLFQLPAADTALLVYSSVTSVGYLFPLLVGALACGAEFRHRTLTPTFLAEPRRGLVLVGKAIALAMVGAIFGLAGVAASVGVGAPVLVAGGGEAALDDPDVVAALVRAVLAMLLWAVIGVGLGSVVSNQITSIVIVLAFTQFVEPILRFVGAIWEWSADLARFLPGAATDALVGAGVFSSLSMLDPSAGLHSASLEWWQGGLSLVVLALVLLVAGWLTNWRRDVS